MPQNHVCNTNFTLILNLTLNPLQRGERRAICHTPETTEIKKLIYIY